MRGRERIDDSFDGIDAPGATVECPLAYAQKADDRDDEVK